MKHFPQMALHKPLLLFLWLGHSILAVAAGEYTGGASLDNAYDEHDFLAACRTGNVTVIEYFLSTPDFDVNEHYLAKNYGEYKTTGLYLAACFEKHDAVKKLVDDSRTDINKGCVDNATPLYIASVKGYPEIVKTLLDHGANPFIARKVYFLLSKSPLFAAGGTLYHTASNNPKRKALFSTINLLVKAKREWPVYAKRRAIMEQEEPDPSEEYLGTKPLINVHNEHGFLAACRTGNLEAVQFFVDKGVNIHKAYISGASGHSATGLNLAVGGSHLSVARYLLEKGVTPDPQEGAVRTPLTTAINRGDTETVNLLLEYKADINRSDKANSHTPLLLAARNNQVEILITLLKNGADPNLVSNYRSPLYLAAFNGNHETVRQLLNHGADLLQQNRKFARVRALTAAKDQRPSISTETRGWQNFTKTITYLKEAEAQKRKCPNQRVSLPLSLLTAHSTSPKSQEHRPDPMAEITRQTEGLLITLPTRKQ